MFDILMDLCTHTHAYKCMIIPTYYTHQFQFHDSEKKNIFIHILTT